jgi:hypothetical protein
VETYLRTSAVGPSKHTVVHHHQQKHHHHHHHHHHPPQPHHVNTLSKDAKLLVTGQQLVRLFVTRHCVADEAGAHTLGALLLCMHLIVPAATNSSSNSGDEGGDCGDVWGTTTNPANVTVASATTITPAVFMPDDTMYTFPTHPLLPPSATAPLQQQQQQQQQQQPQPPRPPPAHQHHVHHGHHAVPGGVKVARERGSGGDGSGSSGAGVTKQRTDRTMSPQCFLPSASLVVPVGHIVHAISSPPAADLYAVDGR